MPSGCRHFWIKPGELFSSAFSSLPLPYCWRTRRDNQLLLCQGTVQVRTLPWSQTPASETGFLCDVELVISQLQYFFHQVALSFCFPFLSLYHVVFRLLRLTVITLYLRCPFSDILYFADISVFTCRTKVLVGGTLWGFFHWQLIFPLRFSSPATCSVFCYPLSSPVYLPFIVPMIWCYVFSSLATIQGLWGHFA